MFLIYDTETTDLFNKNLSLDNIRQARVCQLAALLLDESFDEVGSISCLIKPDKWVITPGAQARHHITMKQCFDYGVDMPAALELLGGFHSCCFHRIAHNIQFDNNMIDLEQILYGVIFPKREITDHCTMHLTTDICKLPTKYPGGKFKWPKLVEAYQHIFGQSFEGQHDALQDVKATAKIFKWLVSKGLVNVPKSAVLTSETILDILGNPVK